MISRVTDQTTASPLRDKLVRAGRRLPGPVRKLVRPAVRGLRGAQPVGRPQRAAGAARPTLNEIGLAHGTDKSSEIHDYLEVYERAIGHLRDRNFQLVEIGVHKGSSTRMWAEYFQQARIIGVDIKKSCKQYETDRIRIRIGNQSKPEFLARLARETSPLVVVDDGSHVWRHQIDTFRALFPVVRPGGYFIVEDIHTSFGEDYAKTYGGTGQTAYDYVADIARGVVAGVRAEAARDEFEQYCRDNVESMLFLPHAIIVKKKSASGARFNVASVADLVPDHRSRDVGPDYERIPADLVDAGDRVQHAFAAMTDSKSIHFEPAASAELDDVTVYGGGIAVAQRRVLAETLNCAKNVRVSGGLYKPTDGSTWVEASSFGEPITVHAVPGKHHVLMKQTWDRNYGHWLVDALPKLGLLPDVHEPHDCLIVLNTQPSDAMRQVVLESLARAGYDAGQAIFLPQTPHRFERLTVLGTIADHPTRKSSFAIRYLEELAANVEPAPEQRIYLSRNRYTRRRLLNEDEVVEVLHSHGYSVVHTETMSLADQMATFRGATHVIGNMGASMANLAFSPPGVSVLALATERMNHDYFYDIVCHKDGRYQGLQGKSDTESPDLSSDFTIPVDRLHDGLRWLHQDATVH